MKRGLLLFASTLIVVFAAAGPEQPLPFSHKTHTEIGKLKCEDCHTPPAKFGAAMGFPSADRCMTCHFAIAKDKPAIRKLADIAVLKQAIPWTRVYKLKDFVFFDHRFHLMNETKCEDCHGTVAGQDVVADELGSTKMVFCQGCHIKMKAARGCNTCHDAR